MRNLPNYSAWLVVIAVGSIVLLGAAPHIDEQLHLTMTGEVSCSSHCGQLRITLAGTKLGDATAEKEIATSVLSEEGGHFLLTGSVLVGYEGKPSVAPSEREVSLEFRASACPPIRKTFPLSKFARDKYGYLLDTGKTEIKCANEK
jgi:hypothetical protein